MKIIKKQTYTLEKCYSIAPLEYNGKGHILIAAEKTDPCLLFDQQGNYMDKIWDGPGGTMSMVQIPGSNGEFLATHQFYSPNDSKDAKIMYVKPSENGKWKVKVLIELPFVHRFDIVTKAGVNYLFACTLKSGHEYKEDWSSPGKVLVGELPSDLAGVDEDHPIVMKPILEGLLRNHGYCKVEGVEGPWLAVAGENGIYRFTPPKEKGGEWEIGMLTKDAGSDMAFADLDGDSKLEMLVMTPFHGDTIKIYKEIDGQYQEVFTFDDKYEFAHGIWGGKVYGQDVIFMGHRQGKRNLYACRYDQATKRYVFDLIDENIGPANLFCYEDAQKKAHLVSTNREINEIAFYEIEGS